MRLFIMNLGITALMLSCHSQSSTPKSINFHEVVVVEALQASQYTYLRLKENDTEHWVALPKTEVELNKTYYYKGGFLMKNFVSKDLNRTFEEVYFIGDISTEPITAESIKAEQSLPKAAVNQNTTTETLNIHTVVVKEVSQANNYTYLLVSENGAEHWVALPKTEVEIGNTYSYEGGFLMSDFESKDLDRTFDEVYFITGISTNQKSADNSETQATPPQATTPHATTPQNTPTATTFVHKVVVKEVLQANSYTYLLVTENEADHWVALPKTEAEIGKTYYYEGGSLMADFQSKDLNRIFDRIYFITAISAEPITDGVKKTQSLPHTAKTTTEEVKEIKVDQVKDGITIAQLLSNTDLYANKVVKIKGEVTKFNEKIMGKNWIHIQDGTNHSGNFDLTATTDAKAGVGDVVTIEGKVTLDKDFGYGYFYEVLIEDAKISKE